MPGDSRTKQGLTLFRFIEMGPRSKEQDNSGLLRAKG